MNITWRLCLIGVVVVAFISIHHQSSSAAEIQAYHAGERDALIQLRDALTSTTIDLHSIWTGPPCADSTSNWLGLTCSNSHVVGIVLDGFQLTGLLPAASLQEITYLTRISFRNNLLLGPLPGLAGLVHLRRVVFSHNLLSGSIPFHYTGLPELTTLELEENLLSGTIPPFDQPTLEVFNVSRNFLEGSIPETSALQRFPSESYGSNLRLCGKPLAKACAVPVPPLPMGKRHLSVWSIALIAVSAALLPFAVMLVFLCYFRKIDILRGLAKEEDKSVELTDKKIRNITDPEQRVELQFFSRPMFDLDDLLRASAEMLGKGKLGSTYKVNLESGPTVAVKRLKEMNGLDKKGFVQQMQLLGKLKHENLIEMISFYYSKEEKLVVYEYVPCDGSLFQLLHEGRGSAGRLALNWTTRLSIVKGVAQGLAYLHGALLSHKVPHANLKSSNILVCSHSNSNKTEIYLTDYGFLPLVPSRKAVSDMLSLGRCPEFGQGRKLTHKADIYCFGIVLLEVITGRRVPPQKSNTGDLCDWVRTVVDNDWSTDILDLEILGTKDAQDEMLKLAEIALECTDVEPEKRPKINQVLARIQSIADR